jgi:hypothetical protein
VLVGVRHPPGLQIEYVYLALGGTRTGIDRLKLARQRVLRRPPLVQEGEPSRASVLPAEDGRTTVLASTRAPCVPVRQQGHRGQMSTQLPLLYAEQGQPTQRHLTGTYDCALKTVLESDGRAAGSGLYDEDYGRPVLAQCHRSLPVAVPAEDDTRLQARLSDFTRESPGDRPEVADSSVGASRRA